MSKAAAANLASSLKKTSFVARGKAAEGSSAGKQFLTFIRKEKVIVKEKGIEIDSYITEKAQFFTSNEHYVIDKATGYQHDKAKSKIQFNFENQTRENGKLDTQENFTINSRYVIFWNRLQVLTIDLKAPTIESGVATFQNVLPHKIDDKGIFRETSKDSISDVLVGKNGNEIFLVVDCLDHNQHILIKYDIKAQQEMQAFTI